MRKQCKKLKTHAFLVDVDLLASSGVTANLGVFHVAHNIVVGAGELDTIVTFDLTLAHALELPGELSVTILHQSRLDSLHGLLGMDSAVSDLEGVEELASLINLNTKSKYLIVLRNDFDVNLKYKFFQ